MASIETASDENGKYYELHITIGGSGEDEGRIENEVKSIGWSFSKIDGDIQLGKGVKYYATTRLNPNRWTDTKVLDFLIGTSSDLTDRGLLILREKIEVVIHDSRTTKVRIEHNPIVQ
jgi:hypothetical protein